MIQTPYDTVVLITYNTAPDARERGYEDWLRAEDNPTFNSRPGIAHYANWKVDSSAARLPFTHFDLLGLTGLDVVERVWFDPTLDAFRAGWVAKWGYGKGTPAPESRFASLGVRAGGEKRARTARLVAIGWRSAPAPVAPGFERWTILEALRKHWAAGPAPAGEPWRFPAATFNPLGLVALDCRYLDDGEAETLPAAPPNGIAFIASCIAG